jgi:integrase
LQALERFYDESMSCAPDDYQMRFRGKRIKKRYQNEGRERTLTHDELAIIWRAAGDAGRFGVIIKLCCYTGQRLMKVLSMQWRDVNLTTGAWTIPRVAGEKHAPKVLMLPAAAVALIEAQPEHTTWVFPSVRLHGHMVGLAPLKRELEAQLLKNKKNNIPRWVMHDLRRTARTYMEEIAVQPQVAEKILGHKLTGVMKIYARHEYILEMKDALARLADHIDAIVEAGTTKTKAA